MGAHRRRNAPRRAMPPIDLMRIGEIHFVRDGHHRVSVARALGRADIDAYVTEVVTRVSADRAIELSDLPLQEPRARFPNGCHCLKMRGVRCVLSDPWDYAELAEGIEAWASGPCRTG